MSKTVTKKKRRTKPPTRYHYRVSACPSILATERSHLPGQRCSVKGRIWRPAIRVNTLFAILFQSAVSSALAEIRHPQAQTRP